MALALLPAARASAQSAPAVTLSSTALIFGPQLATTTSAPQMVTLTNSGNAPLVFAGVTLDGSFAQTNTCPSGSMSLAAGANCTFSITFNPIAGSDMLVPGFIEIMDNATPAVQVINLQGTATAFSLSASPTSATVGAGATASFTISVTPIGGFNAAVSLSCGTLPTGAACLFSSPSVTPNGSTAATSTMQISTSGMAGAPGGRTRPMPPAGPVLPRTFWLAVILSILSAGSIAIGAGRRSQRGRRPAFAMAGLVIGALLMAALAATGCGGGGSSSSSSSNTPAGNYTVLVTGSTPAGSGTFTSPVSVTLNVN